MADFLKFLLIFRVCYSENQPVITVVCDCNVLLTGVLPVDVAGSSRETASAAAASCKVTADDDSDRYLQLVLYFCVYVLCVWLHHKVHMTCELQMTSFTHYQCVVLEHVKK